MAEQNRNPEAMDRAELLRLLVELRRQHGLNAESGARPRLLPEAVGQVLARTSGVARPGGKPPTPGAAGAPGPAPVRDRSAKGAALVTADSAGTNGSDGAEDPAPDTDAAAVCPYGLCGGKGWYTAADELVAPCRCVIDYWSHQTLARRLQAARIPAHLQKAQLATYRRSPENAESFAMVSAYIAEWEQRRAAGDGFGIIGPVGSGKTHLLITTCNELVQRGGQGLYISMINAFSEIARGFRNDDAPDPEDVILGIQNTGFLALDDLGAEAELSAWERRKLLTILDYRFQNQLATVFTSNFDLPALNDYLGDRCFSRLIARAKGRVTVLTGRDRRIHGD